MALSYTPETESPEPDDAPGRAAFLFSLRSMFAPPAFLAESAWLEHIPFAFWTVAALRPQTVVELGVYNGPSYFAFCQAVAELGLDARCYGVDTWKGDAHAGLYGEEIHQRAQAYNDAHYSSFSRLVRSTFDEAAPHFSDGSIDLLHIDGLHAYEAVRHDFETWLPKLSDRAVVLLHDVNVRERGFGVFKFFEEIRRERPTFEFSHGHGLGVVGVGALQSEWMTRLYEIDRDADAGRAVRETFARLGRGCAEAFEARRWEEAAHKLRRALDESGAQLREASAAREAARGEIEAARAEGRRLGAALEASAREAAAARTTQAALAERAEATEAAFQKVRAALSETEREAIAAKAAAEALETRVLARLASLDELRARLREAEARRDAMADAAAEAGAQSETRVEEIVTLTKLLGEAETKAAATRRELDAKKPVEAECGRLRGEAEALRAEAHALSAELAREKRGAARLGGEREALLASSSWRLTAPLRAGRRKLSQAKRLLRFEKPDPLFDAKWYLDRYEDVRNSGMEPYDHFVRHGAAEGRSPGPLFDARWYLDRNPDVRDEGLSPFKHYVEHGDREGRDPNPYFDTSWYREHYPDVATANTNALRHFIRHGAAEGRNPNPLFDTSWYMEQNPDAAELGLNPLVHYKLIGKGRKADPSLRFDTELYLRLYKDVADAGVDPLDHFLRYGQAGGRVACVPFSPVEAAEICVLKPPAVGREAALFVTHSPAGRLKPHVRHYLHALRRQGVDVVLLVAADAEFVEADAALLGEVAGLVVRRNSGLDFAAWAHALRLHPELYGVEILYLLNDSLFGPTNDADFAALLSRIRDSAADFVGLTESQEISWHVQSFFVALKARALASRAFHKFIDGVVAFADKDKVIRQYEVRLAPTLRRAGLVCEVAFPSTTQSDNRTLFDWRGLIDEGFPFVKVMALRDGFADDGGRSWREVLAGKGYDVSLAERTLAEARGGPKDPPPAKPLAELKALHIAKIEDGLSAFLASGARLRFTRSEQPAMSIVLVLFNKAHFTYACLASLERRLGRAPFPYEIIVYDNGSSDRTGELLERCDNLVVRRDESNLGFLRAVNAASELARGETLLLLNNDTELPEGTLEAALDLIRENDDVGAVGARLILPDGLLQEAGSIMWNDGTCLGYRRGADPEHFEANFRRDVDYCSGAFLLTRTALFHDLGRFNEIFVPAYYEETDYCLRLWENGWRIVYDPAVVVNHFEFASAANNDQAIQLQIRNRDKFLALHADTLARHLPPAPANVLFARTAGPRKLRLLVIDDFVPHDALGAGFPRARRMIEGLRAAGAEVTLLPTFDRPHPWTEIRKTLDPRVEVAFGYSMETAFEFIKARAGFYDAVLVSRPHNMTPLNAALEREPDLLRGRPVVYDAEALFTDRDIALKRLRGETVPQEEQARLLEEEMQIARFASTVLCVSPGERDKVARRWPDKEVRVLGHALEPRPTRNGFAERGGILFVGAIHADHTPNGDSIIWFVDKVLPLLRQKLREPFKFIVAGLNKSPAVSQRVGRDVVATGALDDLSQLFGDSRIFVAPTRFAAGIPHKIHEAASRGLPCVTTPLLAGQLGWRDGRDLLTGDDAEAFAEACARLYTDASLWARLRENALERVRQDCSPERFKETIDAVEAGLAADMKAREAQG